ncbi:MAG: hypothetical protein IPF88_00525 [Candidatus Microthrix sp.]|nr:hypothetical protein [Candidatus Microthrix sp.]MBK6437106.1 hypothetical protein [Candidatus Microthrix sp.]
MPACTHRRGASGGHEILRLLERRVIVVGVIGIGVIVTGVIVTGVIVTGVIVTGVIVTGVIVTGVIVTGVVTLDATVIEVEDGGRVIDGTWAIDDGEIVDESKLVAVIGGRDIHGGRRLGKFAFVQRCTPSGSALTRG